ncbi:post-GPI attachment to proteins factor 3-like isoform X2 [Gordionus sp. m RMFG-2023]|uniref:post-GPI attachment to proteins factor 3-like isoform X2 n=1 Tax=Gordionus sp. m RMFG-2023 TaxID=3053472 RepID=UPI0031FE22E8
MILSPLIFSILFYVYCFSDIFASSGDELPAFNKCAYLCFQQLCTTSKIEKFNKKQSWYMKVLLWSCENECKYICMHRVKIKCIQKKIDIPQFYGKWPFRRIYGIQDPASFVFSILNFLTNAYMIRQFVKYTHSLSPYYVIWIIYGILSLLTWMSSTIYHMRDTHISEKLDYFSALLLNCYFSYTFLLRAFGMYPIYKPVTFGVCLSSLYLYHIYYMTYIKFDYSYNMKINVFLGLFETFGWLIWAIKEYNIRKYVWRCILSVIIAKAILPLELGDFPPLWDLIDAHSLWHLFSLPLPIIWFKKYTNIKALQNYVKDYFFSAC